MISILLPTYNRSALLLEAIASVLKQDFQDWQLVVMDDCSTDDTQEVMTKFVDPRIKYVRAEENIGQNGDIKIYRKFLAEHCDGEYFIILCDDDYWLPVDLLSRQVMAMEAFAVGMVIGGVAQKFPTPVELFPPNAPYIKYRHAEGPNDMFAGNLYPAGFLPAVQFLELFASDPKNRNIVSGATLFRTEAFKQANILDADLGWQAGYAFTCGIPANGWNVYYIDEPCMINRVGIDNASFRGTQARHFRECLCSIDAAFFNVRKDSKMERIRQKMAKQVFKAYLCNKIAHKLGGFKNNPLGDISHILVPAISADEFIAAMVNHELPVTDSNLEIIRASDLPEEELRKYGWPKIVGMAA